MSFNADFEKLPQVLYIPLFVREVIKITGFQFLIHFADLLRLYPFLIETFSSNIQNK